ncbi:MAG: diguanylate cyclase, partial [Chloroflexi bacterium]|nr:diguanylate cyclase [Chloroflexota bacterium]
MLNNVEARDASIEPGIDSASEPPSLAGTIKEVRRLKYRVQFGVFVIILALIPLHAFVFQMATTYVVANLVLGLVFAAVVIQVSFGRMLKARIRAESALREREQQVHSVLNSTLDAVICIDEGGAITDWNSQAEAIFGWPRADVIGRQVSERIIPEEQKEAHIQGMKRFLNRGESPILDTRIEITALHRDGHQFPVEIAISRVRGTGPTRFSAFARDITERKNAEQALRDKGTHDALTGVLNHGAIVDALHEISKDDSSRHSIAMVDVDGLKATNDTYGHQVGDAVLKAVAAGLATEEAVVGRYGGDEFVVLLRGADREAAEKYRAGVLRAFSRSTVDGPGEESRIPIFVSIGLASYPDEADTVAGWLGLADNAMYAARKDKSDSPKVSGNERSFGKERAAKLVAEIVPLLTRSGTREDKLDLVAQLLSVSAGYDGVNFEVSGDSPEPPEWQSAHVRAPKDIVDAWMREQSRSENHPLGKILEETRSPVFLDDVATDERLTKRERELLTNIGFKSALVVPMIWQDRMVGMLSVGSKTETGFHTWDAQFLTAVASQVTAIVFMTTLVEELQAATDNIKEAHSETVMMLASVAEANDNTTGRHLQRVRALTEALAIELEYDVEEARNMGLAAVLHDIGKIQVPNSILTSSNSLSEQEWEVMRRHTVWGAEFLRGRKGFDLAEIVAHSHHERWDGGGYPAGLKGDEISEAAAIT